MDNRLRYQINVGMGNDIFIAQVVEVEDTHISGRTGNWTRNWINQVCVEEPGGDKHYR